MLGGKSELLSINPVTAKFTSSNQKKADFSRMAPTVVKVELSLRELAGLWEPPAGGGAAESQTNSCENKDFLGLLED